MFSWIKVMQQTIFGEGWAPYYLLLDHILSDLQLFNTLLSKGTSETSLVITGEQNNLALWGKQQFGKQDVLVPCIAVPGRHPVAWCNLVLHTSDSFPSAVMQITNNKWDVAGGKNHPSMGKFTSDWVECLQTWKLDWGEQSRSHKLIRFAEAVLFEFSLWEIFSKWVWLLIWLWQL